MENTIIHPDGPPRFGRSWSELTTVQNYFKLVIEQGNDLIDFAVQCRCIRSFNVIHVLLIVAHVL